MEKDFRTTKRRWIKLYPIETLNGSIRYQLTSAERGVFYDLLCFSSLCSNTGDICDRDGKEYPMVYIANRLNIQMSLLKITLEKCALEGRITVDDNGIHITNWARYQSDYDRQKPYREAKKSQTNLERTHELMEEWDREHPNGEPKPTPEELKERREATADWNKE